MKKAKKHKNDRLKKKYIKFLIKNKDTYYRHYAVYGRTVVIYNPWSFKNIINWIFKGDKKPGFTFLNPEECGF